MGNEIIVNKEKKDEKREWLAAYALNLCTVSVSQILDYNDPVIMEQEYDAILNNLNLQSMPKEDIALLDVLDRIMETITFFRINEKEKQMVEKEYQQKMKNAIWNAVPNFGLIVAGGNPVSMAISLVSQVGIGYMNYRKEKANNQLEYDREVWELEKVAIEQIDSLKRQLFATAWKMSRTYDFEDRYRLTERQIHQYNEIVMDNDMDRKYQRLCSISHNFEAYPPFWYNLGNTANLLGNQYIGYGGELELQGLALKEKAKECYERYISYNDYSLLRENPITSACCLEYVDLLDVKTDKEKMDKLITDAVKYSGGRNDIMQMCVFAYLRVGDTDKAKLVLLNLINENYNKNMNAQLLSRIYVSEYINLRKGEKIINCSTGRELSLMDVRASYGYLKQRARCCDVFSLPDDDEDWETISARFETAQKRALMKMAFYSLREYFTKLSVEYNALIPIWDETREDNNFCYSDTKEARAYRVRLAQHTFRYNSNDYRVLIEESRFWKKYLDLFDKMSKSLNSLNCVTNIEKANDCIKNVLCEKKSCFSSWIEKLNCGSFGIKEYEEVQELTFLTFVSDYIKNICSQVLGTIINIGETDNGPSITDIESNIRSFCVKANIEIPDDVYESELENDEVEFSNEFFSYDLLISDDSVDDETSNIMTDMLEFLNNRKDKLVKQDTKIKVSIITRDDLCFKTYLNEISGLNVDILKKSVIAVIDDKSKKNRDLLLTIYGIVPVVDKKIRGITRYDDSGLFAKLSEDKLRIEGVNASNAGPAVLAAGIALVSPLATIPAGIVAGKTIGKAIKGDYYENDSLDMQVFAEIAMGFKDILNNSLYSGEYDGTTIKGFFAELNRSYFSSNRPTLELAKIQNNTVNRESTIDKSFLKGSSFVMEVSNSINSNPYFVIGHIKSGVVACGDVLQIWRKNTNGVYENVFKDIKVKNILSNGAAYENSSTCEEVVKLGVDAKGAEKGDILRGLTI